MKRRTLSCLAAALAVLLGLAACGQPETPVVTASPSAAPTAASTPTPTPEPTPEPLVYVAEYSALPQAFTEARVLSAAGDKLYTLSYGMASGEAKLNRLDLDTLDFTVLADLPAGTMPYAFTTVSENEGWYLCPGENGMSMELRRISLTDGQELDRRVLEAPYTGAGSLLPLGDGRLGFSVRSADGQTLYALTPEGDITELGPPPAAELDLYGTGLSLCAGLLEGKSLGYDLRSLYTFTPGQTEKEPLLRWLDLDIEPSRVLPAGASGSDILLVSMRGSLLTGLTADLIRIHPTPLSQAPVRKELTLGCLSRDATLTEAVFDFNRRDGEYRIRLVDYSDGAPLFGSERLGVIDRMNRDILLDQMPDLLLMDAGLPLDSYSQKGLFEDLAPYLAASDIQLIPAIQKAGEMDGKLVSVAPFFSIYTMLGSQALLGEEPGWTADEAEALWDAQPEGTRLFPARYTRASFLNMVMTFYLDEFVDWETGTAHFDSPAFARLLELAARLPEAAEDAASMDGDAARDVLDGKVLLEPVSITTMQAYLLQNARYNGQLVCKGFPAPDGGSAFILYPQLGVSARSQHKEGAWRFLSSLLQSDYQSRITTLFPTLQSAFDQALQAASTEPAAEDGVLYTYFNGSASYANPIPQPWSGDEDARVPKGVAVYYTSTGEVRQELPFYALTEAERQRFLTFFQSIDQIYVQDSILEAILNEEAAAYFAGQADVETVCGRLQSRASTYLAELR